MLETLGKLDVKTHLVMSEWAAKCILMETKYTIDQVQKLATTYSDPSNMASAISSGTHKSDGMIIAPCSMKTLAAISFGYDDTLVARAGVTIKESRKLVFSNEYARTVILCISESVFSLRVSSGLSGQVLFTLVLFEAFTSVSGMSRERFIRSAMPPTSIAVSSIAPAMTSSKL